MTTAEAIESMVSTAIRYMYPKVVPLNQGREDIDVLVKSCSQLVKGCYGDELKARLALYTKFEIA